MGKLVRVATSLILTLALLVSFGVFQLVVAQEPVRDISVYAAFPSLEASSGETVSLNVSFVNMGKVAEDLDINISMPEDWTASLTDWSAGNANIRSLHLEPQLDPEELPQPVSLKLTLTPAENAPEKEYILKVEAVTRDKQIMRTLELAISIKEKADASAVTEEIELTTNYPIQEGHPGTASEFQVSVKNVSEEARTFDLSAEVPLGYDISFSPNYQKDRSISAIRINAGSSESIAVGVSPRLDVEAGEYPIVFKVSSGDVISSIDLKLNITGTSELILTTLPDRPQLNATATAGKATQISIVLANNGTAALEDIDFSSTAPEGWTVTFDPDKLTTFEGQRAREIDVSIAPGSKAIAGDYVVTFWARSKQDSDNLDFRVTVETATTWGWVGIIIVIIVIAVLIGIFARLRRR